MSRARLAVETMHILVLSVWLAAVLGATLNAAVVFPAMKSLSPRLPEYAAFAGDHSVIAGGTVARHGFLIADFVQFPAALLTAGSLILLVAKLGLDRRRLVTLIRAMGIAIAVASLASLMFVVTPRLDAATSAHWAAAKAGDDAGVAQHRAAAADVHPLASTLLSVTAGSVLLALGAAVWSMGKPADAPVRGASVIETPRLARGRGA